MVSFCFFFIVSRFLIVIVYMSSSIKIQTQTQIPAAKYAIAARRIQRWYRARRPLNTTCALTLEPLNRCWGVFRFYPPGRIEGATKPIQDPAGRPIGYDLRAIIKYLEVSKKRVDPNTRATYSQRDLTRIERLVKYYHIPIETPMARMKREALAIRHDIVATARSIAYASDEYLDLMMMPILMTQHSLLQKLHEVHMRDPALAMTICSELAVTYTGGSGAFSSLVGRIEDRLEGCIANLLESFLAEIRHPRFAL